MARVVGLSEVLLSQLPLCHWAIDRAHRFRIASGDSRPIFNQSPAQIRGRSVPEVLREPAASEWNSRIDRILAGEVLFSMEKLPGETGPFLSVAHFPIHSRNGGIEYAAGCALDASHSLTSAGELEVTARLILKLQEAERANLCAFLHNELAQNLSAAGLQFELLRMDLQALQPEIMPRLDMIQELLEDVIGRVRVFNASARPGGKRRSRFGRERK